MSEDAGSTEEISDISSDEETVEDSPAESDVDSNSLSLSDDDDSMTDSSLSTDEFSPAGIQSGPASEASDVSDIIVYGSSIDSDVLTDVDSESSAAELFGPLIDNASSDTGSPVPVPNEPSSRPVSPEPAPNESSSEPASRVPAPNESSSGPASPRTLSEMGLSVLPDSGAPSETSSSVLQVETTPSVPQVGGGASSETGPSVPLMEIEPLAPPISLQADVIPSPKRRRVISPEKKTPKKDSPKKVVVEDDDCCSICFESWTTSGDHRPASLKCGHLFGFLCIDKWLKGRGEKCPQCNAKAKRPDIRIIFTKNIKAVDTHERDHALEQLAEVQKRNTALMMETAHLGLKYQVVMSECSRLQADLSKAKEEILVLKVRLNSTNANSSSQFPCTQDIEGVVGNGMTDVTNLPSEKGRFVYERGLTISEGGNCRVITHSPFLGTITVSQPSSVAIFPGFGVKKISSLDFKTTEYMTLHSKAIRGLCFHPTHHDGVLLSCSLDKTVKLTSMISNTVVQSYNLPMGAWSCVWNTDNHNYFYVGLQNGLVQEYDVRNTSASVLELNSGSRSPVASLQYVPACPNAPFRPGGLVVGQLNQVSFYEKLQGTEYRTHLLPLEGNISSLCFDTHTRQLLASFRSSNSHPKVRHMICELGMIEDTVCGCNVIQTFYGGTTQTLLSHSLLIPHPKNSDHLLVCAGDEASRGVKVWNGNSFRLSQDIPCEGPVVDLCHVNVNNQYLLALTDKKLTFHEWKE